VVVSAGDRAVDVRWAAVPGAAQYVVTRSTMQPDGLGGFYPISTTRLTAVRATTHVDRLATNGRVYAYAVRSENAAGSSAPSAAVQASPKAAAPTTAPGAPTGRWKDFRGGSGIVLTWEAVPGATGYVLYRSGSVEPAFTWPTGFRTTLLETTFFDQGDTAKHAKVKGLDPAKDHVYQISAVNTGGVSPPVVLRVPARAGR
jgi:hypothetical protein